MASCFEGLVGITRKTGCPCYESSITTPYRSSKYDLFLDELNGGITLDSIQSVSDCGGTLLQYFTQAISQAQSFFKADILADLSTRYKTAQDPFVGYAGSRGFTRTRLLQSGTNTFGVKLEVRPKIGAYFTVSQINIFQDQTLTGLTANIFKVKTLASGDQQITLVHSQAGLQSTAGAEFSNLLTTPVNLPLFELDGREFYYLVLLERKADENPKDNANRCNCGRSEMRMLQYFNPSGVEGVLASQQDPTPTELSYLSPSSTVNGVLLYGEARCGADDVICDAIEVSEAMATVTAYAQWYKAGAILVDKILASPEINKYTMSNREYLYGRKATFEKEYFSRIRWIGENISLSGTDCYQCDEEKSMRVSGILG